MATSRREDCRLVPRMEVVGRGVVFAELDAEAVLQAQLVGAHDSVGLGGRVLVEPAVVHVERHGHARHVAVGALL